MPLWYFGNSTSKRRRLAPTSFFFFTVNYKTAIKLLDLGTADFLTTSKPAVCTNTQFYLEISQPKRLDGNSVIVSCSAWGLVATKRRARRRLIQINSVIAERYARDTTRLPLAKVLIEFQLN